MGEPVTFRQARARNLLRRLELRSQRLRRQPPKLLRRLANARRKVRAS